LFGACSTIAYLLKESLVCREISIADLTHCTGAYGKEESVNHLFFECDFFGAVLYEAMLWLNFFFIPPKSIVAHYILNLEVFFYL
jgi:hypothetical protein